MHAIKDQKTRPSDVGWGRRELMILSVAPFSFNWDVEMHCFQALSPFPQAFNPASHSRFCPDIADRPGQPLFVASDCSRR